MPTLNGKEVGATGLGLMRMTWHPEPIPDEQAFAVMKKALETGCNFWNSGEFYGNPPDMTTNLQLIARYFTKYPEDASKVVLSVKGCADIPNHKQDASTAGVKKSIDNVLRILDGKKSLDLFESARVDTNVPIEETIRAVAEYVKEGKVGGICLSEASARSIHRAAKVHKIAGVEVEYSLFSTDIRDNGVLDACKEHNIPIIAYSPVGAGFLSGQIKSLSDFPENDFRRGFERFQPENFQSNFELVDKVNKIADKKNVTPSQLALEWCRHQPNVIPIPGTRSPHRVEENAQRVYLTDSEADELENILSSFKPSGDRYMKAMQTNLYADSPPEK